nr:glycosyltransferase family 4 protein [Natronoarchaeum rubrum]
MTTDPSDAVVTGDRSPQVRPDAEVQSQDDDATTDDDGDVMTDDGGVGTSADEPLRVLNLVTNDEARFYKQQVSVLEAQGVSCTTLAVPSDREHGTSGVDGRSLGDYVRFYPQTLLRSFEDFDLIHANYGLTGPAAVLQPNLPVVLSLWGSDLLGTYGPVSKLCARRSDEVIVMSDHMADALGRDCHVIPHGVDLDKFAPQPQRAAQEELGWDSDALHVLFPYARSKAIKNPARAERVVAAVRERLGTPVELQFVSGVPHDRMPTYMNAADALLLTSDREGSPNSVKEALACNLPVVSTDVGDVRQRLSGVRHSFVGLDDAELVDCLVSILDAGAESNGREVVRELSVERMGEQIRDVYRDVVES